MGNGLPPPATPQAGGTGDPPQPQAGEQTPPTPQAGSGKSPEDYERMLAELRRENAGHRTKLKKFEEDESARTQAQMTEQEKLQQRVKELEAQHQEAIEAAFERNVETEVTRYAATLGLPQNASKILDKVAKMLDWEEIEVDEATGKPTNIKKLVDALDLPGLFKTTPSSGGATNPSRSQTGNVGQITRDNLQEAMAQYDKLTPAQQRQVTSLLNSGF